MFIIIITAFIIYLSFQAVMGIMEKHFLLMSVQPKRPLVDKSLTYVVHESLLCHSLINAISYTFHEIGRMI